MGELGIAWRGKGEVDDVLEELVGEEGNSGG